MLFGKLVRKKCLIIWLLCLLAIFELSACTAVKDRILILEDGHATGFTMDFKKFNSNNKCELSLAVGDRVQVNVEYGGGEISLAVSGKKGSEPYTGKALNSGMFTFTASETDEYVFRFTGKNANGRIAVKKLVPEVD